MGEHNHSPSWPPMRMQPDIDRDTRERAEQEAVMASLLRRRTAEAEAMRQVADMNCPEDVKEYGRRHGLPTWAEFTWSAGFAAGYAAGLARLKERQQIEQEADSHD